MNGLAEEQRLDQTAAESRDRFGRDYLSASYGMEIPPDNMEELLKAGALGVQREQGAS